MTRLAADAAHQFGGIEIDRSKPLRFRLDGHRLDAFAGDTVLSAALANGLDTYGLLDGHPVALTPGFAPPVTIAHGVPMPMDAAPARDGADYTTLGRRRRTPLIGNGSKRTLAHDLAQRSDPDWSRRSSDETLTADLLVIGGGVAGLAAADAAARAGRRVILCERRAWFGGDARYYGPVGDDESPEAATVRLLSAVSARPNVTLLPRTAVLTLGHAGAIAHQTVIEGTPHGRIIAIAAIRTLIATGTIQRLPVFPGNRLPGVMPAIDAYHLAKRYGVVHGETALVATQGNFGYRLAMRLNDAGVAVRRIVDARLAAQSRFIDFAKASGLTLSSGQMPASVSAGRQSVAVAFVNVGAASAGAPIEASQLIVAGGLQPDLALWMMAGGSVQWNRDRLAATGHLDHLALAGSVAGYRSLTACVASGRSRAATLFGEPAEAIDDVEIDATFETPDAPAGVSPLASPVPAFLDSGGSLAHRQSSVETRHRELSVGDVAASVELGTIAPSDAAAVAEERGAPGGDLVATSFEPAARPAEEVPVWLAARFGPEPVLRHLVVDGKRRFERGALVYLNTGILEPTRAIGVIVAEATPGGTALVSTAHADADRFIVQTTRGLSPARIVPAG